ncbi:LysR family transcriptional regulator [Ameyamaea chiangmaiensis NBRC 103196]|nr:LysR family transcriptional regulator [Ameyamaea chiangmaiensis NBRC 103196]
MWGDVVLDNFFIHKSDRTAAPPVDERQTTLDVAPMSYPTTLLGRLKLRHLRLLIEIADSGSLHRASANMNISQPTASKLLQEVEIAMSAQLFERSFQGMVPTLAGQLATRYAQLLINDLARLQRDISGLQSGLSGTVQIGAIGASLPDLVSPVIAKIGDSHPNIRIILQVGTSDQLVPMLAEAELDLLVGRHSNVPLPTPLDATELSGEPLCIVTRTANPLPDDGHLTLQILSESRWIMQTAPSPMRRAIEVAFTVASATMPSRLIEVSSLYATVDLLRQGDFLAVLPFSVCRHYVETGTMRVLSARMPDLLGPYSLLRVKDRPLTAAAAAVSEQILQQAIGNMDHLMP